MKFFRIYTYDPVSEELADGYEWRLRWHWCCKWTVRRLLRLLEAQSYTKRSWKIEAHDAIGMDTNSKEATGTTD